MAENSESPANQPASRPLVFISHASDDAGIAVEVCQHLECIGISCWIAPRNMVPGLPYPGQLVEAIRTSRIFLLIFTERANRSRHVLAEIGRAFHFGQRIVTFRIEKVQPKPNLEFYLSTDHYLEATAGAPAAYYPALVTQLRDLLQREAEADREQPEDDPVPETFAHFRLLRRPDGSLHRLGKGGMGVTWKALDTTLDRTVALKVIGAEQLGSPAGRQRFLREAQSAAKIFHQYVAAVLQFGVEQEVYFYAMEFVEGEDLERYVARSGPLPPPLALRVALQTAQALEAAQKHQLIHRDIKPGNLMAVPNEAGTIDVKLIDFGLAKVAGDQAGPVITARGQFLLSPAFASPEQCEGAKLDIRSDIYSLGVTLWYLLSGERPFSGTVNQLIIAHASKPPPFERLRDLPPPIVELLKRMLAKDPAQRPQTPVQLQAEIQTILAQLTSEYARVSDQLEVKPKPPETTVILPGLEPEVLPPVNAPQFVPYLKLEVGALFAGRYRLQEESPEGIGGRLFLADDQSREGDAPRQVAIKVLHPALFEGEQSLVSLIEDEFAFIHEAPQPTLLRYYRFDPDSPAPYLAREWVHGFLLEELLRWRSALSAPELAILFDTLAPCLDHVVAKGFGLVEVTARKLLVPCPPELDSEDFRDFARRDVREWPLAQLRLNPLSLGALFYRFRLSRPQLTVAPSSQELSRTQSQAGLQGAKAVRLFGRLIYAALSGKRSTRAGQAGQYSALSGLNAEGNHTLLRACAASPPSEAFKTCEEFWTELRPELAASRVAPPVTPKITPAATPVAQPASAPQPAPSQPTGPVTPPPPGPGPKLERKPDNGRRNLILALLAGAFMLFLAVAVVLQSGSHTTPVAIPTPAPIVAPTPGPTSTPIVTPVPAETPTAALTPGLEKRTLAQLEQASQSAPFVNGLGMKFVPVPGVSALFSVWDTRVEDYRVFVAKSGSDVGEDWSSPGFAQDRTDPVVNVSWQDAQAFCAWLTKTEQAAGRLPNDWAYRLPTDAEWSRGVDLGDESGNTPKDKDGKITGVYPWGTQWPPPKGAGNYYGEENASSGIKGYNDGFKYTSPVGSFNANRYGLFDMGGNVWQWCEDWYDSSQQYRVLRGGSWVNYGPDLLLSSYRNDYTPTRRGDNIGFRCVVGPASGR